MWELINKISEVSGYKINIQRSLGFLYTDNKLSERGINNATYNSIKKNKIPKNKFNQGCKRSVHIKDCKKQMKEMKEDKNGKIVRAHRLEEVLVKCPLSKVYIFKAIPIIIPMAFFTEVEYTILNSYRITKDPK